LVESYQSFYGIMGIGHQLLMDILFDKNLLLGKIGKT